MFSSTWGRNRKSIQLQEKGNSYFTWKALSGQLWKKLAIAPAFLASGGCNDTVGAGRQTSMKSATIAMTWVVSEGTTELDLISEEFKVQ